MATNAGPPATDDRHMKIEIATLTNNARAYAAGTHRLAAFTVPPGETAISINNVAGTSGDMTTLSTWYEAVPTAGTVTLGADNDLNSARDWAVIAVAIKAAGVGNAAPSVSLTSPAQGAAFTAPASITLTADAQDSDGTVAQVEFFQGATLVATVTTPPYTFTLNNVQGGSYSFTAKATDNLGANTTSTPVAVTVNAVAQMFFIHTDHLNTPRVITNQAAQVVWRWDHTEPFGSNPPNENPSGLGTFTCNLRLPGQYFDQETNTHYNYFRDYDPAIGRYVQSDPVGLIAGINTYSYVDSDPLRYLDLNGLGKQGGTTSVGGNDPLIPRSINKNTPRVEVEKQIAMIEEELKRNPNMNLERKKALRRWMKVAKRGFTKVVCPPFLEEIAMGVAREQCLAGDINSCKLFEDLGGEIISPYGEI